MRTALYAICQCTWGILQTLLGFVVFLVHVQEKHDFYHGAIVTGWNRRNSASIGPFLFITKGENSDGMQKSNPSLAELSERLLVHEYGHTIQSLILGPLYLIVIGLPSVLWCSLPCCRKRREKENISYYSFYTEKWADRLGERVTGKKIMDVH